MKTLILTITILISGWSFGQAIWSNSTFVHQDGREIKDGQNNQIHLEGVNLGGWLMWEGWIWNGGFTQQKIIQNTIETELGTPAAIAFRDSVYANYVTEDDISRISNECFNVVRIPFNHYLLEDDFTPYNYKPEGWAILDSALAWCERNNVYAILDLHSAPGGQSNLFTADPDLFINLWNGTVNQTRTAELWKQIANRYKDRGIIAGYDLLNEPVPNNDSEMLTMYQRIVDSIRTVDNNHMLFIEGSDFSTDFSIFSTPIDPNMVYEFHLYSWFISDIAAEVQIFTDLSQNQNVPIWCGEWGENTYSELETTLNIFRDPSYEVSGSAFWTWKKAERNGNYLDYVIADTTTLWNKTIAWIGDNNLPQPTTGEMQIGINEFIENIKMENCAVDNSASSLLIYCGISEIEESMNEMEVIVFPNPNNGQFYVEINGNYDVYNLVIRNAQGKKLSQYVIQIKGVNPLSINGEPGIYFIELNTSIGQKVFKVVSN